MGTKLHNRGFLPPSSSSSWLSHNSIRSHIYSRRVSELDYLFSNCGSSRKRYLIMRLTMLENRNCCLNQPLMGTRKKSFNFCKSRKIEHLLPLASADDGVTVNGTPEASTTSNVEEMRVKLNQSLKGKDYTDGIVQALHEAARVLELALKEHSSLSKYSWFSTAWIGVDMSAWIKTLSYQASVFSLLQAASEISSRSDSRDRDVYIFVQRSLLRQVGPVESLIREKLLAKQSQTYDWFLSEQVPSVVASFVHYFEADQRFTAATAMCGKDKSSASGDASDISLLMLALTCIAAISKLGPAKVSCPQFFSMLPETTGRLMDKLVDLLPIGQAYNSTKDISLCREFLVHFGPRAAACRVDNDRASEEVVFWVDLVQKKLQRAIDREKIWSRLTTSESIEVLERDLAIFGFFIALGRSTKSFLSVNGFDVIEGPLDSLMRYLIGGSVLYYPQLASISSYQLYVEVVSEELDWFPFYPDSTYNSKQSHGHKNKREGPPNANAIPQVLDVCSHWLESFIKYSKWLENPSNIKAAKFVSRGHNKLTECMNELGMSKNELKERTRTEASSPAEKESDSFDKALESVEEALIRLEKLLQQLHVSSSNPGKEQLKAACSDLEKIRKLKKEAEFLEASFRAKTASLQQGDDDRDPQSSISEQQQHLIGKKRKSANVMTDRSSSKSRGLWRSLMRPPSRKPALEENECLEQMTSSITNSESNDIYRFELLRNELIELEKRVQRSADQSEIEEDIKIMDAGDSCDDDAGGSQLVPLQKNENIIGKSIEKLKETSTDVLQGTQLLATDVAAAMGFLRRALVGDELTEKEKKSLRRTLTDLASVVPIGVLMLLPVTAVGHAAMLAAIKRYFPAMIPSTYGPERLDLYRQLEKVKELDISEVDPDEDVV